MQIPSNDVGSVSHLGARWSRGGREQTKMQAPAEGTRAQRRASQAVPDEQGPNETRGTGDLDGTHPYATG